MPGLRTLQQDVEFGIIQIVDIALRAMSPGVNDPSTAISCLLQGTRRTNIEGSDDMACAVSWHALRLRHARERNTGRHELAYSALQSTQMP